MKKHKILLEVIIISMMLSSCGSVEHYRGKNTVGQDKEEYGNNMERPQPIVSSNPIIISEINDTLQSMEMVEPEIVSDSIVVETEPIKEDTYIKKPIKQQNSEIEQEESIEQKLDTLPEEPDHEDVTTKSDPIIPPEQIVTPEPELPPTLGENLTYNKNGIELKYRGVVEEERYIIWGMNYNNLSGKFIFVFLTETIITNDGEVIANEGTGPGLGSSTPSTECWTSVIFDKNGRYDTLTLNDIERVEIRVTIVDGNTDETIDEFIFVPED